mgnify:CR=1 FL=1
MDKVGGENRGAITIGNAIKIRLEVGMGNKGQFGERVHTQVAFKAEPSEILGVGIVLENLMQNFRLDFFGITSLLVEIGKDCIGRAINQGAGRQVGSWHVVGNQKT